MKEKEFPGIALNQTGIDWAYQSMEHVETSEKLMSYLSTLSKEEYNNYIKSIGSIKDNCIEE